MPSPRRRVGSTSWSEARVFSAMVSQAGEDNMEKGEEPS